MLPAEKVRENRIRRAAERQGRQLSRSRRRDPRSIGYGMYQLSPDVVWKTLDEVEQILNGEVR